MLKSFKIKILRYAAHLLAPYLLSELNNRDNEMLAWFISHFKSCGKNFHVGPSYILNGMEYITIGDDFYAGAHFRMEAFENFAGEKFNPQLIIGNNVGFQELCHVGCVNSVSIGDGCLFASKVFITDHLHGNVSKEDLSQSPENRKLSYKPVKIGKNVWVGDGVCILPGVTLGDNVIVGANAVVTHSFPANSVIAGCPAKIIKTL